MEQIRTVFGRGAPEGSIYDILKSEHRQIKASLQEIINSGRILKDVFAQTTAAIEMHMEGEEKLLYPRFERYTNTRMLALKSYEEHHLAMLAINDINSSASDERWIAKIAVLYDVLNHHIDQEENDVFPNARKVLTDTEAMQIGREYRTQAPLTMMPPSSQSTPTSPPSSPSPMPPATSGTEPRIEPPPTSNP